MNLPKFSIVSQYHDLNIREDLEIKKNIKELWKHLQHVMQHRL